jgi:exodeoxyribonuclease VII large subunit
MSENELLAQAIRLSDLSGFIKNEIARTFQWREFLIIADTSDVKDYPDRQYCFLSLIEKDDTKIAARAEAVIWKSSYHTLTDFKSATGRQVTRDMKLLMRVNVDYHEVYGLKLVIREIDARFSMGQIELEKQKVIHRLLSIRPQIVFQEDGQLTSANKNLKIPSVITRIALITAPESDGGRDFLHELTSNTDGYTFIVQRFDVQMQGEQALISVPEALNKLKPSEFDLAVLIRGGGSATDLAVFDRFEIPAAIAACKVPLITGIGHERNISVCDMVAAVTVKTPTKAAVYIIENKRRFENVISHLAAEVSRLASWVLKEQTEKIHQITYRLHVKAELAIASQKRKLERAETVIRMADPLNVLKKGYAMLYSADNKVLTNSKDIKQQNILLIRTQDQLIKTEIKETRPWQE